MSNQISWLITNFYGALNISSSKKVIVKRSKKAGVYSDDVSTDTLYNIKSSTGKVGNAMRKAMVEAS